MKLLFLIIVLVAAQEPDWYTHDHEDNEGMILEYIDYVDSLMRLSYKALHLGERVPRQGKEFKMGLYDGLFKF